MSISRFSYAAIVMLAIPLALSVNSALAQHPQPEDWPMPQRASNGWSYSPLDQINRDNVVHLQMVWSRGLGPGFQQGIPLVSDGTMYLFNSRGFIQAIDAATGNPRWQRADFLDDLVNIDIHHVVVNSGYVHVLGATDNLARVVVRVLNATTGHPVDEDATTGHPVEDTFVRNAIIDKNPEIPFGRYVRGHTTAERIVTENRTIFTGCTSTGEQNTCAIIARNFAGDELWRKHGVWMVPSYDPEENLVYAGFASASDTDFLETGARSSTTANRGSLGIVRALSIDTGEPRWDSKKLLVTMGSFVTTRGGLIFGGDGDGWFYAFNHETGEEIWKVNLGAPSTHFPITYAVDGRQYVAVSTNVSSHPKDPPSNSDGSTLSVFALPGSASRDPGSASRECPLSESHFLSRSFLLYKDSPRPYWFFPFILTGVEQFDRVDPGPVTICEAVHRSTWSERSLWLRIIAGSKRGWVKAGRYDDLEAFLKR